MMKTKSKTASAKAKAKPLRKLAKRTAGASAKRTAASASAKRTAASASAKRTAASASAKAAAKRAPAEAKRAAKAPAKRAAATPERANRNQAVRPARRTDDADAFIRDPGEGPARTRDELAEAMGEDFIEAATSGNEVLDEDLDRTLPEELGGPFVVTRAGEELADDVDASNPLGAAREPIPTAVGGLVRPSLDDDADEETEERA